MLATIPDDTWNVLNIQHITPMTKIWDYSDIPGGGHKNIKEPTHMAEGGYHLRKAPNPHPLPPYGHHHSEINPTNSSEYA